MRLSPKTGAQKMPEESPEIKVKEFLQYLKESDYKYDPWGTCTINAFAICDAMTDKGFCPDYWIFRQGVGGSDTNNAEYEFFNGFPLLDLVWFSRFLHHWYNLLKISKKAY